MGCTSAKGLDLDQIHSPIVLRTRGENSRYHGTTERGRLQTLGDAELVLTEDGIYSQVLGTACCGDQGYLHIPITDMKNIREQAWFNGLYRLDRPHLVISYVVPNKGEFEAGWQMNSSSYDQWQIAIRRVLE